MSLLKRRFFALSLTGDAYPQQRDWQDKTWLERQWRHIDWWLFKRTRVSVWAQLRFVRQVRLCQQHWQGLDESALDEQIRLVRLALRRDGMEGQALVEAFALVCMVADRVLGKRPYDVQLRAAYVLSQSFLIEMATGEGKTLTASLAAAVMALSGRQVQVVTVNDYLASRDRQLLAPLFERLGLSHGVVLEDMAPDERLTIYAQSVVYCTGKTLVFDYLRDRMTMRERLTPEIVAMDRLCRQGQQSLLLKGLQSVVVDEADSVLIDEAKTPLVISRQVNHDEEEHYLRQAMQLARQLVLNVDFVTDEREGHYALTEQGRLQLTNMAKDLGGVWKSQIRREEAVLQAITALNSFHLGIHYIVRDAKVMIVDENTGRVMPDRSWERGLHQLIEIKEGVELTPPKETMAKLSFQLFFRRFLQLSGMSGTCQELASELHRVYGVGVISIPSRLPSQRRCVGRYVFRTAAERDIFAVRRVLSCQQKQQPVLVGTRSVNSSEGLSQLLIQQGVRHAVLNANQDADEASVVAQAGELAQVTIATNMAGRGTDIHLAKGVAELGGLHVLIIERNDNARIDRQLIGRCARQGDPGSWEMLLSLEDELLNGFYEPLTGFFQAMLELFPRSRVLQWLLLGYYRLAQRRREKMHRRMRDTLQKSDMQMRQALSFSGKME